MSLSFSCLRRISKSELSEEPFRGFPCGLGWRGWNKSHWLALKPAQAEPKGRLGQGQLEFPQGKEEICKEEVVESQGEVPESRQIDRQKQRLMELCECDCHVAWTGGKAGGRQRAPEVQVLWGRREGAVDPPGHQRPVPVGTG